MLFSEKNRIARREARAQEKIRKLEDERKREETAPRALPKKQPIDRRALAESQLDATVTLILYSAAEYLLVNPLDDTVTLNVILHADFTPLYLDSLNSGLSTVVRMIESEIEIQAGGEIDSVKVSLSDNPRYNGNPNEKRAVRASIFIKVRELP